jgi:transcriptional regulator with XRE-family HTH domain
MEKEKFTQELKFFLKKRGIKQNDLAKELGVSHPVVSNVVNGRDRLGTQSALKWAEFLKIDPLWLMTQGEQGTAPSDELTPTPKAPDPDIINIPILSLDARGGFLPNDKADIEQYTIGVMPFNKQIAHTGDVVIPVYGDSMTPKYPAGSFILIRPIEAWREYIELGRSYVLELADWRRIIKIVRKGSDSTHYTLDSYNVDYESNEVAISFINNVWLVVASVNREEL